VGVRGIDHLAITVDDVDRTLAFYRRVLDAQPLFEELWRAGKIPVVLLQVGASRLSIHSAKAPASPHARIPLPGSADFCLRWDGAIESAIAHLRGRDVEIVLGPVPRPAADGAAGQSVYFRDPDGNLLELLSTDPSD
jgi:catechol 2,3-dioxygenase-like lactoylglutathione lyase family enzyme